MAEGRSRANSFHLRLTDEELDRLLRQSAKVGIKPQAYIHAVLNGYQIKEKPPADFVQILKTLQQINNNMNQIAIKVNSLNSEDIAFYWKNVDELTKTIQKLLEVMYG